MSGTVKYRVTAIIEPVAKKTKPILPPILALSGPGLILFVLLAPFLWIGLVAAGLLTYRG